jgi:hypothetical protein
MNNIDNLEMLKLNGINIIDNFLTKSECHNLLEESCSNLFWTGTKVTSQLSTVSFYEDLSNSRDGQVLHECDFGYNLKAIIVEIVKQFQHLIGEGAVAACLPPGGPPAKRDSYLVLFDQILTEMSQLSASVEQLHRKIDNR